MSCPGVISSKGQHTPHNPDRTLSPGAHLPGSATLQVPVLTGNCPGQSHVHPKRLDCSWAASGIPCLEQKGNGFCLYLESVSTSQAGCSARRKWLRCWETPGQWPASKTWQTSRRPYTFCDWSGSSGASGGCKRSRHYPRDDRDRRSTWPILLRNDCTLEVPTRAGVQGGKMRTNDTEMTRPHKTNNVGFEIWLLKSTVLTWSCYQFPFYGFR